MPSIILEQPSSDSNPDLNLKEWSLKSTNSRRYSASNLKSFRDDEKSSRSNFTNISSTTVSSPGYSLKDEIDPSTYSFTTALKALQAKTVYSWEYVSSDGYTLNSKWNEAEKYICNPLSGEVPLECLSAKTLSGRSFRSFTSTISISAPLIYPSHFHPKSTVIQHENEAPEFTVQEKKKSSTYRDVGIQITPADLSSDISSVAAPTPTLTLLVDQERLKKHGHVEEAADLSVETDKSETQVEERERKRKGRERKRWRKCSGGGGGGGGRGSCLPLKGLWQRQRCKSRNSMINVISNKDSTSFLYHINASYNQ